ncbi:hypothetical protein CBS101457_001826 [Exobasidium rhododendri]|nr:hypothetical protein CBS101457_001826 [Exobasidium rhododendri]
MPDEDNGTTATHHEFQQHQWNSWLDQRQTGNTWIRKRKEAQGAAQGRLNGQYEWRETWLCDHSGTYRDRRLPDLSPQKRRKDCNTHNSKKVGCMASIVAKKVFQQDTIQVVWRFKHTGHDAMSLEAWSKSALPPAVKGWITQRVAEGRDWNSIHDLLRVDPTVLDMLDKQSMVLPASLRVKRMDVYNALRQAMVKASQRNTNLMASVQLWCDEIHASGGWTYTEDFDEELHKSRVNGWMVSFSTKWQRSLLSNDGQVIVCLDATHNTCAGTSKSDKVQLYSLVIRNSKTGQGCPAAFMLTNNHSSVPIKKWLHAMKTQLAFYPQYFMIDCSDIEALGIHWAYAEKPPQILYCDWHLMKSIVKRAKEILSAPIELDPAQRVKISQELRKSAKEGFIMLMNTCTSDLFDSQWIVYQEEWSAFPKWIQYVSQEWICTKDRWCRAWRQNPHQGIDTNNYIERWHGRLKKRYLGLIRRQRMDYLIHLLVDKILPDYQQQEKAAELGLVCRTMNKAEKSSKEKAYLLESDEAASMLDETAEGYIVQSFTVPEKAYHIHLQDVEGAKCLSSCLCPNYLLNHVPCKHMWLVVRTLGIPLARHILQEKDSSTMLSPSPCPEEAAEIVELKQNFSELLVQDVQRLLKQCLDLSQSKQSAFGNVSRDALLGLRAKLHALNFDVGDLLCNRQLSAKQLY